MNIGYSFYIFSTRYFLSFTSSWSSWVHLWRGRVSYGSAVWDTKGSRLTGLSHTGGRRRVSNTEHCTLAYRTLESTGGEESLHTAHCTLHYIRGSPIDSQCDCTRLDGTGRHWTAQAKETPMLLFQHCIARQRLHCFSIHWASSLWGLEQQSTSLWGGEQHSTHPDCIPSQRHTFLVQHVQCTKWARWDIQFQNYHPPTCIAM